MTDESLFGKKDSPDVYIVVDGEDSVAEGQKLARNLRGQCPGLRIMCQCGGGKPSQHVKRAFDLNARMVAVMHQSDGEAPQQVKLRSLDDSFEPVTVLLKDCEQEVARLLQAPVAKP